MLDLDRSKTDTPIALDLLRAIAAQMVCVGHALSFAGFKVTSFPLMQNIGVLLFFTLSGFLIARTIIDRSKTLGYGYGRFFVDRFARIYSSLIPSLVFVAIIDGITISITGSHDISRYYTLSNFILNMLLFNDYRGTFDNYDNVTFSAFGSASPMWTLTIEWHIYLFVAAIFFIGRQPKAALYLVPIAILFGQVPAHYIFGAFQSDGVGQSLFLLWLGGAVIAIVGDELAAPRSVSAAVMAASVAGVLYFVQAKHEYDPWTYPLIVAFIAALILFTQRSKIVTSARFVKAVRFTADYSFTLYLTHYTVLTAFDAIRPGSTWPHVVVPVIVTNLLAVLVAMPTEMKHRQFANFLTRILSKRSSYSAQQAVIESDAR
jgi:peptidoglycan/LPS O-acetylase OafA/YrhL